MISAKLMSFIRRADNDSVPHAHDVRKVAASFNFFATMNFKDLQEYTGWKSSKTFFEHYCKDVSKTVHSFVAAGAIVEPSDDSSS